MCHLGLVYVQRKYFYVLIRCAQTNVNYFLLKYYKKKHQRNDGWMLRQSNPT